MKNKQLQNIEEIQEQELLQAEQEINKGKSKKSGVKSIIAFSLAIALLIGSSFAYFTDYATQSATGTAGTLSIALESDINLLNEDGQDILNPGDIRSGSFTVTNMGNKSADIRTTIALTAYDRDGAPIDLEGSATTQSMYDLYLAKDVEYVDGRGNIPKQGVQPLQTKNVNGNVITYSIPEYSLNGNSDLYDEVETISNTYSSVSTFGMGWMIPEFNLDATENRYTNEVEDSIPDYKHEHDFVLVFNTQASNAWQGSVIQIDIIVEAKQHENTSAGWELVEHEDLVLGSLHQGVVLPENVITTNGVINPGYEYTPSAPGGNSGSTNTSTLKGTFYLEDPDLWELIKGDFGISLINLDTYEEIVEMTPLELVWDDTANAYTASFNLVDLEPDVKYSLVVSGNENTNEMDIAAMSAGETLDLTINLTWNPLSPETPADKK